MKTEFGDLIELEQKSITESDDSYHFSGYAAWYNNVDRGKDMIVPGAFAKSLREIGLPQLLYQHEMKEVVGVLTDAREDQKGLFVKGEMPKADDFVRGRLYPQLKKRSIKSMSIGYKAIDTERNKSGVRVIKEAECWECSFVTIPMNPKATVTHVKSLVEFQTLPVHKVLDGDGKLTGRWDAKAALERLKARFDGSEEIKTAFLFADEAKPVDEWDIRLLIGDVDESGCIKANQLALFKASAAIAGARGGVKLSEDAQEAVKEHLECYYRALDLDSPFKSLSADEFDVLDVGEREARLRQHGLSRKLAARFSAQRDAERAPALRDAGSSEDALKLLAALSAAMADVRKR